MTRDTEQTGQDALPEGVAPGRSPGMPVEADQLEAGGVGPGGQVGPDPETKRLQEGKTHSREENAGHEGPISGSVGTPSPTRAKGDGGAAGGET